MRLPLWERDDRLLAETGSLRPRARSLAKKLGYPATFDRKNECPLRQLMRVNKPFPTKIIGDNMRAFKTVIYSLGMSPLISFVFLDNDSLHRWKSPNIQWKYLEFCGTSCELQIYSVGSEALQFLIMVGLLFPFYYMIIILEIPTSYYTLYIW